MSDELHTHKIIVDASKGTKQRCRPTCAACKTYKRRKGK